MARKAMPLACSLRIRRSAFCCAGTGTNLRRSLSLREAERRIPPRYLPSLSRRDRIRTLVQLRRITERHSIDELGDPHIEVHHKMVELLKILAADAAIYRGAQPQAAPR